MKYMFKWRLWVIVFLSTLGFIVKFIGGYLYCSKALFVDALTNIANIIALSDKSIFLDFIFSL